MAKVFSNALLEREVSQIEVFLLLLSGPADAAFTLEVLGGSINPLVVVCDGDHSGAIFESGDRHGGNPVGGDRIEFSAARVAGALGSLEEGLATIGGAMPNRSVIGGGTAHQ